MKKRIVYEDNPWPDVKIENLKIVKDLLPPPEVLRKAEIRVIGEPGVYVHLSKKDMDALKRRARKQGVPSHILATAILHSFVAGNKGKRT